MQRSLVLCFALLALPAGAVETDKVGAIIESNLSTIYERNRAPGKVLRTVPRMSTGSAVFAKPSAALDHQGEQATLLYSGTVTRPFWGPLEFGGSNDYRGRSIGVSYHDKDQLFHVGRFRPREIPGLPSELRVKNGFFYSRFF